MGTLKVTGYVDDQHRLTAEMPACIPSGPVTVLIKSDVEDDAEGAWMRGIAQAWAEDLADKRQNIYSIEDGEPLEAQ